MTRMPTAEERIPPNGQARGHWRQWSGWPLVVFLAILFLAVALRFSHLEIAHFQVDQALIAKQSWEWAREGIFPSHFFHTTGGYSNFPLTIYLYAPLFLFSEQINLLILGNIALNLGSLVLCWYFARRYWGWSAALVATLLLATAPWHVFYAHRLWGNSLMPFFVMLWVISSVFAFHERRPRWWALSWAMASLLFQLHSSGALFLIANGLLWLAAGRRRAWRWGILGFGLAALPSLPWLWVHLNGSAQIDWERVPFVGEGKRELIYNWRPLGELLTASDLSTWFRGENEAELLPLLEPLKQLAPLSLLVYGLASVWVARQAWRSERRQLYRVLACWLFLFLLFPFISYRSYTIIYYLPILPAPFLAAAALWSRIRPRLRWPATLFLLFLVGLPIQAILGSASWLHAEMAKGEDELLWAVGGGVPLRWQQAIADAARGTLESGVAAEIILLLRPVYDIEHEHLSHALPLLTREPVRIINLRKPHRIHPAKDSAWVFRADTVEWPAAYAAGEEAARFGPYRLHLLPGGTAPAPQFPLSKRNTYENGLRLLGYDALGCEGSWRLHWTPGPVEESDQPVHFFVHLLNALGETVAQHDLPAYDIRYWQAEDEIITQFDFGQELADRSIATLRVGLYYYSDATMIDRNIYALDEQGRPWQYAIDIPFGGVCES